MKNYEGDVIPMNIWVASMDEWDSIKDKFQYQDGSEIQHDPRAYACTLDVVSKDKNYRGDLIVFRRDKQIPSVMAHEAFHVAHNWYRRLGMDFYCSGSNESWAYMIEWTVRCMVDYFKQTTE